VIGLRVEAIDRDPTYDEQGVPVLLVGLVAKIRLFGRGFNESNHVAITTKAGARGDTCQFPYSEDVYAVCTTLLYLQSFLTNI